MKLLLRIAGNVLTAFLFLLIASTVVLAVFARRSDDAIPSILGQKVLTVMSGSMEPAIKTGDVILVKPLEAADQIQVGDVITFRAPERADMLITHRVVEVRLVDGRPSAYITKGDANASEDIRPVSPEQILGRYTGRIPYYGYLSLFVQRPAGTILLIIVPGLALIAAEARKLYLLLIEAEKKKAAAVPPVGNPPK